MNPENDPELVASILEEMKWDAETLTVVSKVRRFLLKIVSATFRNIQLSRKNLQGAVNQ